MYKTKIFIITLLIAISLIGYAINNGRENDVTMEQNEDDYKSNKEGELVTTSESFLDFLVSPTSNEITEVPENKFTEKEIEDALQKAYEYFEAVNEKDRDLILESMYPDKVNKIKEHEKTSKVYLYDESTITPVSIEYMGDNHSTTKSTSKHYTDKFVSENILVLFATIEVKYPKENTGSWTEGTFPNNALIMVRDDKESPWFLYEKGF